MEAILLDESDPFEASSDEYKPTHSSYSTSDSDEPLVISKQKPSHQLKSHVVTSLGEGYSRFLENTDSRAIPNNLLPNDSVSDNLEAIIS